MILLFPLSNSNTLIFLNLKIGTFSDYIIERRDINNRKVKFLDIGCLFFFISLALMVLGIIFFMFNV